MFFSELYKIMVNKASFVGFRGSISPLDRLPWSITITNVARKSLIEGLCGCAGGLDILKFDKYSWLIVFVISILGGLKFCLGMLSSPKHPRGNSTDNNVEQRLRTYGTRTTLDTSSNFWWHAGAPNFTYQFCYDAHRRYIDLGLQKKAYGVGTLNVLKPWVGTLLAKGCRPLM